VVGNVSLRRALGWGGYMLGNVAVHPDWQERGIAGRLLEAALNEIERRSGRWVGLEVRAGNEVARQLYERRGFREVGRTAHYLRPGELGPVEPPEAIPELRRGRGGDHSGLVKLLRDVVPAVQRPLLELRQEDYHPGWERALDHWLEGRRERWWVVEEAGEIVGAVRALRERKRRPDRIEVLVHPRHEGRLEGPLVRRGVAGLSGTRKVTEALMPAPTEPMIRALEAAGFERLRGLVQMQLDLGYRIPLG